MAFTVGLDLDGTTADYYAGLRAFAAKRMKLPHSAFGSGAGTGDIERG